MCTARLRPARAPRGFTGLVPASCGPCCRRTTYHIESRRCCGEPMCRRVDRRSADLDTGGTSVNDSVAFGMSTGAGAPEMPPLMDSLPLGDTARVSEPRSEEHTSELQSLMRNTYAGHCLTKKN